MVVGGFEQLRGLDFQIFVLNSCKIGIIFYATHICTNILSKIQVCHTLCALIVLCFGVPLWPAKDCHAESENRASAKPHCLSCAWPSVCIYVNKHKQTCLLIVLVSAASRRVDVDPP